MSGNSQAVRLPKGFRFEEDEVYIRRTAQGVLLSVKSDEQIWDEWASNLAKYDEVLVREQPAVQEREGLNGLFA